MQDAVFSWTENVRDNAFTVCVEEMQKFSGVHRDVKVVRSYLDRGDVGNYVIGLDCV